MIAINHVALDQSDHDLLRRIAEAAERIATALEAQAGTSETAPDGEPIRTYHVGVYEPAVDPGGYNDIFTVRASHPVEAQQKALEQAYATWRDAHGELAVFSVEVAS